MSPRTLPVDPEQWNRLMRSLLAGGPEVETLVQSVEQRLERMERGIEKLCGVEEQADDWFHYLVEKGGDVSAGEAAGAEAATGRVKAVYEKLQSVSEELQVLLDKVADDPEGEGGGGS